MVRLVDALVHGGGDDDDDDDGGGGYYYFAFGWEWEKPLLEGTLVFDKSVALQGVAAPPSGGSTMGSLRFRDPTTHPPWLPEPGEAAGGAEPANVVRGVVRARAHVLDGAVTTGARRCLAAFALHAVSLHRTFAISKDSDHPFCLLYETNCLQTFGLAQIYYCQQET
ncbi:Os03g0209900 [Oryza sativa Japonica Group]|uniref:Os03g0209900 protein n=1 Tax=Oryza sativa subsp. japonica TaxID=39947 RepID=A0A0P0VUT8_ORYSJ|nr:Os03g0209900 [Oryza sativa Japonica Group]